MTTYINIAAYKFAPLTALKVWRERLLQNCKAWELKGTILLSPEGINLFVAGQAEPIENLLNTLAEIPGLGRLEPKFSESDHQPFRRMLVRLKKEIIAFGVPGIEPGLRTSPKISAQQLKQWLDEGRPLTLLDTRNDYEVKLGTFHNAVPIGIDHFRDFPAAVRQLPAEWKQRPIVMFCTGGIRCEKAGPFMEQEGFEQVVQLEGGILKYFEECGQSHYSGECFVFDQRVGVDPSLHETGSTFCYRCLTPLTAAEQADVRFVPGQSCPYCFATPEEMQQRLLTQRQQAIAQATSPLPGCVAYDNERPLRVPARCAGMSVIDFLGDILPHVPRGEWLELIAAGRLLNETRRAVASDQLVQPGEQYFHWMPGIVEPAVNGEIEILHEDEAILVVNKPAPLPTHAGGRFNRNTLQYILKLVYHPQRPRPAHRLDANTTGVMVVARTKHFAGLLQPQFASGEVKKTYWVRVQGNPPEDHFHCHAAISPNAGDLGTRTIDEATGLPAHTEFRVIARHANGTTTLEAIPHTGRTNQIRLHLWQLGWPVFGEQTYLAEQHVGDTQTHALHDAPLCLHAKSITFRHPLTRAWVTYSAPLPAWCRDDCTDRIATVE
jgi:UPF0176 protein